MLPYLMCGYYTIMYHFRNFDQLVAERRGGSTKGVGENVVAPKIIKGVICSFYYLLCVH